MAAMRNLIFLVLFARFWWSYAGFFAESRQKKQMSLKIWSPIFLTEETGKTVTITCPVKSAVRRVYKYIRRIKNGRKLESASRKLSLLLELKYKWYKDGRPISHHRSAWFMKLQKVQLRDSGLYTCKVSMAKGGAIRNFTLRVYNKTVSGQPILKTTPKNVASKTGVAPYVTNRMKMRRQFMAWPQASSLKLRCYVSGDRPLKFQWYKNGKKLTYRRLDPKITTSSWTLRLRTIVPSDSGVYTCVVSNPYGVFKHNITVIVLETVRSAPVLAPNYPKNISASTGQNVSFDCFELVSETLTNYRWYKWHSVPASYPKLDLQNASQYTIIHPIHYTALHVKFGNSYLYGGRLTLTNISQDDVGMYTCVVSNHVGPAHSNAFLSLDLTRDKTVSGQPILETTAKNISSKAGETLKLECTSKNTKIRPRIQWLKWNTKSPEFSNDIKPHIRSNFKKSYELIDSKYYEHFVLRRRNGRTKESVHGFRLRLKNVKPEDSGMYSCLVRNEFGEDQKIFFVGVQSAVGVAPYVTNRIKMSRQFMAWPAASSPKLRCYVSGDRPLKFQWYKDGKKLTYRRLDPKITTSSWTLRLRTIVPSDSGVYTCVVSNPYGVFKHNITVKVIEKVRSAPVLAPNYPKNISASTGQNVSFDCIELVSGSLTDYRWYKWHSVPASYPKLDLQNASQYTIIHPIHYTALQVKFGNSYLYGGRLTLTNITEDDMGLYTCVVSNHIGLAHSNAFLSPDRTGPKLLSSVCRPSVINVPVTDDLEMDCSATGNPKPNVTWFKNGERLVVSSSKVARGMIASGYTLKLTNVTPRQSGNYSCNVSNSEGSVSHSFNVNIKERLFSRPIILPPVKKAIKFGEKYELKCTVVSSEPLTVHWERKIEKQGKESVSSERKPVKLDKYIHSYSYVIPKATSEDSGVYWCIARNKFGISNGKFEVQVEA